MKTPPRLSIKNRKGFTLLELCVTIIILSLLVMFNLTFISRAVQTYTAVNNRMRGFEEVRFAMELMAREIREADDIIFPLQGASGEERVTAAVPGRSGGDEILDFRLLNGNIIRNDEQHPIAERIKAFKVARTSDSEIRYGPNKLTLFMTFIADDGQEISASMQVIPKNVSRIALHPKKLFNRGWREVVEQ